MSVGTTFEGLPTWAKGVIAVAGTGVVVIVGYLIYSSVSTRLKHAGDYKEQKDVKDDLKDLESQNIKPSFTDSQYSTWASKLFSAFDGYQSDESAVYNVFSNMKNNADVLKLINAYGVREISSGKLNPEPNFKGTLSGAITAELDAEEVRALNLLLANKKIGIKF